MKQDEIRNEILPHCLNGTHADYASEKIMNLLSKQKPSVSDEEIFRSCFFAGVNSRTLTKGDAIQRSNFKEEQFNEWFHSLHPQVVQSEVSEKETVVKDLKKCKHNYGTHYSPETGTRCQGCKQKLVMIQVTETEAKKFKNG